MVGDDGTGNAGDRSRYVRERVYHVVVVVVVVVASVTRQCRVVVGDHAKMIGGASRRRRPVVRRTVDDAVGERNPLADGAVLDDVVVGRSSQLTRVDVRLGDRGRPRLPAQ